MSSASVWIEKLKPLVERDQFIRDALERRGVLEDSYHPELEKIHQENALKLKKLIQELGFPVLSNAGDEGVRLAWLIIQHAIPDPDFMKQSLIEMRLAAAQQDFPLDLLAYTEDRIAFLEGKPQLYGTHFDWHEGEMKLTPVADPVLLDQRRRAIGLPPIAEAFFKITHSRPPKDPKKKANEFQAWLVTKGWRS